VAIQSKYEPPEDPDGNIRDASNGTTSDTPGIPPIVNQATELPFGCILLMSLILLIPVIITVLMGLLSILRAIRHHP
jgi:hypothetical protein